MAQGKGPVNVAEMEGSGNGPAGERRYFETLLRLLPVGLCISALVVMLKTKQSDQYIQLEYNDIGAFRFLAYANGICAGYSFISAFESMVPASNHTYRSWILFLLDQGITYLLLAGGAGATEVLYVAYKGDEAVIWEQVCGSYGRFCSRAAVSVIISFFALVCFLLISILSSYRLFSKYDPPIHGGGKLEDQTSAQI